MHLFAPLKNRSIAWLWGGQLLSSVGNELNGVAVVWIASGILGYDTGLISALQFFMLSAMSLLSGIWADRWHPIRTMVIVDVFRLFIALIIPFAYIFGPISLSTLIVVIVLFWGVSGFFDPALNTIIPQLSDKKDMRRATNGLMATTDRTARIIGPGLVGLFGKLVPVVHFFTIDAFSFLISALSLLRVQKNMKDRVRMPAETNETIRQRLVSGYKLIKTDPVLKYHFLTAGIGTATWTSSMQIGYTLLIREHFPDGLQILGFVMMGYGIGNVASALIFGSIDMERTDRGLSLGRIIAGLGFFLFAFAHTPAAMMTCAAISAFGGPITDLGFVNRAQTLFQAEDLGKIFRLTNFICYAFLFAFLFLTPLILRAIHPMGMILMNGLVLMILGGIALFLFERKRRPVVN